MKTATVLGFFALLAFPALTLAQVTATISGKIEDASGAGIAGVSVALKNLETGATRPVSTNDAGDYRVSTLPIGPYEIRASKAGFKTQVRDGVNLAVGATAVVNLQLQVGDLTQEVTVNEETPVVN